MLFSESKSGLETLETPLLTLLLAAEEKNSLPGVNGIKPMEVDLSKSRSRSHRSRASISVRSEHSMAVKTALALGVKEDSKLHRIVFYAANLITTGLGTLYATSHFFTQIFRLPATFMQVSPWGILMGLPVIVFFSYSEARSHDAASRQLQEGGTTPRDLVRAQASLCTRFKRLSSSEKVCLPIYYTSHACSDIQTLLSIAELLSFDQLDPLPQAGIYLGMALYGLAANAMEVMNTMVSFERNRDLLRRGEEKGNTCSWSRTGFWISNLTITGISTLYVSSRIFSDLFSRISSESFFEPDLFDDDVSRGGILFSLLPVVAFSLSVAKASDAQSKQLTNEGNSDEDSSSSAGALTFFRRFQQLSGEQKSCVVGHYLSEVFADLQYLVLLLNLGEVSDEVSVGVMGLIYVAMFAYGFLTDYQIVPNTIAAFEIENESGSGSQGEPENDDQEAFP